MLRKIFASCALGFAPAIIYGAICFALSVPIHATVGGLICGVLLGAANVYDDFEKERVQKKSIRFKVPR
jgi:membrane associated rhomboid family serine protease